MQCRRVPVLTPEEEALNGKNGNLIGSPTRHALVRPYVGHSVSGMIGMIAAVARPDCFERLILLQPSPRYLNDPDTGYVGGFEQGDLDALYEAMATNYQTWAAGFIPMVMGVQDQHVLSRFSHTLLFTVTWTRSWSSNGV